MKMLLTYPLDWIPLSLAEADASLRKTVKSVLSHKIEGNVEQIRSIPKDCAYIIDGMAALRQLPIPKLACRELANRLLETILTAKKNAKRIDVVFDIYTKNSIKVQKEIEDPKEVCNYSKLFLQVSSNNGMLCFLQMTTKINLLVFLSRNGKNCMIRLEVKRFMLTAGKKPSELHLKAQEEKKR